MKINSIINTFQQGRIIEPDKEKEKDKDKDKEKLRPIMSYYIINNHIYPNNFNSQQNSKVLITKKKGNLSIANFNNVNININTSTSRKYHLPKNNSTLCSNNPLYNIKFFNKNLNQKLSKENSKAIKDKILSNSKRRINTGINSKNSKKKFKKQIKLDSNLMKKIIKPNNLKSMNDIFYIENSFSLNTEIRKKNNNNKNTAITTLNSSKNSSKEKIKIHSQKKFNLKKIYHNKALTKANNEISINKNNFKNNNNNNNHIINKHLTKKNSAELLKNDLLINNNNKGFGIFMNYVKGANNMKNMISNNSSCKSITNTGNNINNISNKKSNIKINITELKNEFINKEINNNIISKYSSIKINTKYTQSKPNYKSARTLSIKTKNKKKSKIILNKLNLELNTKRSNKNKKKVFNNTKPNINKYIEKYLDSPYNKVFQKTSGNYFSPESKTNKNLKDKANKTMYQKKFKNIGININNSNNNTNHKLIENIYTTKINKILKDGMKEINKIKDNFVKHFTTNNSPNKTLKDKFKEKIQKDKTKSNIPKNNESNNLLSNSKKKIMKKTTTSNAAFKTKAKVKSKKNDFEPKTQRVKLLTQNNSKSKINKLIIPKIKTKIIDFQNSANTPTLTNSSRSIIHDSFYYLKESKKLSDYIKNYYKNNKKYPETNLNFYKYGRLIGQGAFGKVNLGLNVLTGRVVAIKSFNKSNLNSNSENMKKIKYETNLMKKLNHPNITKILELFEDKEYILIIMEYINGGNLFSFLKKHRKVSEKTAKLLYRQIILGIKYMHQQGIVHRDIKLENILIDLNNNIKICDFGIGRVLSSPEQPLFDQCGTPMYIAPEILLCSKEKGYKGFPVDIWSSGIVLYILLSGTLPFSFKNSSSSLSESNESNLSEDNNNNTELQYSIINKEPKAIENISKEAEDLLKKILKKNPEKRITCEEILNHPWMKGISDTNKYHLFTKAEINVLSKTYVDYRKDENENLKESFTISNLFIDNKDNLKKNNSEKNAETKSSILAPFNSVDKSNDEDDLSNEELIMDDFNNKKIRIENDIIKVGNKVKEFDMLYELNNNCEVDNGIIINSQTDTISSKSSNNSIYINKNIKDNNGFFFDENSITKEKKEINCIKNNNKEKILNQIELLGYDKKYVKDCVKNNILCHASAAYFLMLNYDNI